MDKNSIKILITGANGYIGSHTVNYLDAEGVCAYRPGCTRSENGACTECRTNLNFIKDGNGACTYIRFCIAGDNGMCTECLYSEQQGMVIEDGKCVWK